MNKPHETNQLIEAINNEDVDKVKDMVGQGISPAPANATGGRPIMYAVARGNKEIIDFLVHDCVVDINCHNHEGITPLMIAARHGFVTIAEELIKAGAYVNAQDHNGLSPMSYALQGEHTSMIKILLSRGAQVNQVDKDNTTPLMLAATNGLIDAAKCLYMYAPDVNHQSKTGETALMYAAGHGHYDMVKLLLEFEAEVDTCTAKDKTALMFAVGAGHLEIVQLLLRRGASLNVTNHVGGSPLMFAAFHGQVEMVEFLMQQGLALDIVDEYGFNPMILAVQENHLPMVKFLLDKGLSLETPCRNEQWTPLMYSVFNGYDEMSHFIIEQHVDLDHQGVNGKTALMLAVQEGWDELVTALLQEINRDESLQIQDNMGWNPVFFAINEGNLPLLRQLINHHPQWIKQADKQGQNAIDFANSLDYKSFANVLSKVEI